MAVQSRHNRIARLLFHVITPLVRLLLEECGNPVCLVAEICGEFQCSAGLPSWTIARTVSSELLGFCF